MKEAFDYIHVQKHENKLKDDEIASHFVNVGWHPQAVENLFKDYHKHMHQLSIFKKRWMQISMIVLIVLFFLLAGILIWLNFF